MRNKEIQITTIIGKGAECNGDFTAESSVRIDGVVNGNVTVTGALTLGAAGRILGDVKAQAVIVGGEITGNIEAPDRVELIATAKVIGDVCTSVIVIDEKAIFQGKCDMNQEVPVKKSRPVRPVMGAGRGNKKSAKAAIAEALKEVEAAGKAEEKAAASTAKDAEATASMTE